MIDSIYLEDALCPLGCTKNDEVILTGRDRIHGLPGEFTVVKCRSCGLMRTNPRPTPESIGYYYPDDYGPYLGTLVKPAKSKSIFDIKRVLRPLKNHVFNFNTQRLPRIAPGRLLEVGCASGAFLHQMSKQGWQVQGIEFSDKAAQAAAKLGYPVHSGSLETAPKLEKSFDLIVGWMVMEHLHDPIAGLKKLRECAKPGAWLVLSVPNAESLSFRLFKEKWYDLHLPNHLYHFTPETLGLVLQAGGWKLERVYHQRVLSNLVASSGYALQDRGFVRLGKSFINFPVYAGPRLTVLLYPIAWLLALFGQTGRMTVWARKTND